VPRAALVASVAEGVRSRLVAIVAGAGYGKTTLLVQALEECRMPFVWCSCDRRLVEARSLLQHLAEGVRERFPGFGAALVLDGSPEEMVRALSNEVLETVVDDFVIALDDVHLLGGSALSALTFLVDDLPETAHLALSGRAPLPFPLARLRTMRVLEIDEDRLAFSPSEAAELIRSIADEADPARVATLYRRTEGWPAGLILGAQSDAEVETGIDHAQFDYLAEEVLLRQPGDVQEFLLDTAVLGRFSAGLAEALSGRADAAPLCERLVRGHLFTVRLDDEGQWYRYHHLLQTFLRRRLATQDPVRLRRRHLRAAAWWRSAGEPGEAVPHLLEAGDFAGAVEALEPVAERMVLTDEGSSLARWLDAIPRPLWAHRSALLLAEVGLLLHRAEHESSFAGAERVIHELIALGDHDRAAIALVRLQQAMIAAGTRPLRRIRSGERFCPRIAPESPMLAMARLLLATAYGYGCRFDEAREELARVLELPGAVGAAVHRAHVEAAEAFYVDLWTGRPQEALARLEGAIALLEAIDPTDALSFRPFARLLRSYVVLELGRFREAIDTAETVREEFARRGLEAVLMRPYRWVLWTALAGLGRWDELEAVLVPPPALTDPEDATSYSYRHRCPAALLAAHRGNAAEVRSQVLAARREMVAFGSAFDDSWFLCDLANAAAVAGLDELAREQARDALAAADAIGSPWAAARAALIAAHVREGPDGGDAHLERALELTSLHALDELWTAREAAIAPALIARALRDGVGPPGTAESLLVACGARALEEALAVARDSDGPLRAIVADAAGRVADARIDVVDRLMRDRDQAVRDAARRSWMRLKARPRAAIEIVALGDFAVFRDGTAVPSSTFVRHKARALLACLVAGRGPVHREVLCDRLWPALSSERAAASLRSTLYDLRRAVEPELETGSPSSILVAEGEAIRLVLGLRDRCDVDEFERLAASAGDDDIDALGAASSLYGGPFAPDWPYEDWAIARREELAEKHNDVVSRLAAALVQAGRPAAAVPRYRRLLTIEPERESWHRGLMRAHAACGERALALRQYHACRTVLRREQGIEPDPETRALYAELLHAEARSREPARPARRV
jgi:DNA-binding SARP family transcriptional activator